MLCTALPPPPVQPKVSFRVRLDGQGHALLRCPNSRVRDTRPNPYPSICMCLHESELRRKDLLLTLNIPRKKSLVSLVSFDCWLGKRYSTSLLGP